MEKLERDFERAFSRRLIQTSFLTSKDFAFDEGFKKYALRLIQKFSDIEQLEEEYTDTIEEAEKEIAETIESLHEEQDKAESEQDKN